MVHGLKPSIRERILETRLGRRSVREIVYPSYVRLYPLIYFMRHFEYEGKRYPYMFHEYGATIHGERVVEIPIALEEVRTRSGKRILEVGNVLSHYIDIRHNVVDKYERAPACINQDILDFQPSLPYDFILSISTVEHIGWSESEREPERAVRALFHMRNLLAPGGEMFVTIPWGQNPALDRHLRNQDRIFQVLRYMRRTSRRNTWVQTAEATLDTAQYGQPYPFANVLVLGYLTKA